MKKATKSAKRGRAVAGNRRPAASLRSEYDFRSGVRGKYAARFGAGRPVQVVVLAPDVAEAFGSARAVNAALRRVLKNREQGKASGRPAKRTA